MVTTPVSYSIDANGSMTSDGLRTFEYDESGRLSKVKILQWRKNQKNTQFERYHPDVVRRYPDLFILKK